MYLSLIPNNYQHFLAFYLFTTIVFIGSKMTKGKGQTGEPTQVRAAAVLRWTEDMDNILLNAFSEEVTKGNRQDGSWTQQKAMLMYLRH